MTITTKQEMQLLIREEYKLLKLRVFEILLVRLRSSLIKDRILPADRFSIITNVKKR